MGSNFFVIENEGHALLGQETAISLGVLRLRAHVNSPRFLRMEQKGRPVFLKCFRDVVKVLAN